MLNLSAVDENKDIATKEYVDGKTGVQSRIAKAANAGNSWIYQKIATLPIDDSSNRASLSVVGRLGGWTNSNFGYVNITLTNRSGSYTGEIVTAASYVAGASSMLDFGDLAVYKQSNKSAIVYLKVKSYYAYDLVLQPSPDDVAVAYRAVIDYDGFSVTPTGTLIWELSTSKIVKVLTDGSVTADKFIGALQGNASTATSATSATSATYSTQLSCQDTRGTENPPNSLGDMKVTAFFQNTNRPSTIADWMSGLHVRGWSGAYNTWELVGPASNSDQRNVPLFVRAGNSSTGWGSWRQIYDSSNKPSLSDLGAAASSHTHGNITSGGDITATAPTVASGDCLVINDDSASKITNGPAFGTSTTTYLRNDGTWATPSGGGTTVDVPTGTISMFAGSTAPTGYLLCQGQAVSRTTYSALFAIIGTTYGTGDGSTTFNLPNLQGKFALGKSSSYALGSTGGAATVSLTTANLPAHTHGSKSLTGWAEAYGDTGIVGASGGVSGVFGKTSTNLGYGPDYNGNFAGYRLTIDASHEHDSVGSGTAHNNMPPYQTVNYIIKT